jgi:hypothetical protein
MLVYNTQNHSVSGLCPLSGIVKSAECNVSEIGSPVLRQGEADTYSVRSLRK